jgi:hypothetical protein
MDAYIDHGRADIAMPEHLLDGPDVIIGLEQVAGKGMTESVCRSPFGQTDLLDRNPNGFLDMGFMQVRPAAHFSLKGFKLDRSDRSCWYL